MSSQSNQDTKSTPPPQNPILSALEKFKKIEYNFNKNFLITLYQLGQIVEDHDTPEDKKQHILLSEAYTKWHNKIQQNPRCMVACELFHDSIDNCHEQLLARDVSCFTKDGDLFSKVFDCPGLDTLYIYKQLDEGDDGDDDDDEDAQDAKANVWEALVGLTRLSTLICIYLKMPIVKEMIDLILLNNPDINPTNIMSKITSEFKVKGGRLKKLIFKMMDDKNDDCLDSVFASIQRVIATFSDGSGSGGGVSGGLGDALSAFGNVGDENAMQEKLDMMKIELAKLFDTILDRAGVKNMSQSNKDKIMSALESKKEMDFEMLISEGIVSDDQLSEIRVQFAKSGFDKMNVAKVVSNLGGTMQKMKDAMENGSEEDIKNIFANAGSGFNLEGFDMEELQREMDQEFGDQKERDSKTSSV